MHTFTKGKLTIGIDGTVSKIEVIYTWSLSYVLDDGIVCV